MPGITNPAEEYFKDGGWAWDPIAKVWKKLILDPVSDRLVIDHPGDIEVVQPVPADLLVGPHGWDGDSWQKLPMVWGYSDRIDEDLGGTKEGAGTYSAYTTAVPAGEVHVIQVISLRNVTRNGTYSGIMAWRPLGEWYLLYDPSPAQFIPLLFNGELTLKEGDKVRVLYGGCSNLDVIQAVAWGYKMLIAE